MKLFLYLPWECLASICWRSLSSLPASCCDFWASDSSGQTWVRTLWEECRSRCCPLALVSWPGRHRRWSLEPGPADASCCVAWPPSGTVTMGDDQKLETPQISLQNGVIDWILFIQTTSFSSSPFWEGPAVSAVSSAWPGQLSSVVAWRCSLCADSDGSRAAHCRGSKCTMY